MRANFLGMSLQSNSFIIPLQSLEDGVHEIYFKINKEFIEDHSIEGMLDIQIDVNVIFTKRPQVHSLQISISGIVTMPCDRCLEPVIIQITNSQTCIVKQATLNDDFADSEDVLLYQHDEKDLQISHLIYENIMVSLPIKKVHEDNKCDTFMTSFIKENEQNKKEQTTDPRWDSLKNIFKN